MYSLIEKLKAPGFLKYLCELIDMKNPKLYNHSLSTKSVSQQELFLSYRQVHTVTKQPVKMTIPVPMTIVDTLANAYYGDENRLGAKLAQALNKEIRALAEAGCTWIQVIFTPDCGLGLLGRNTVIANITNMMTTAKSVD